VIESALKVAFDDLASNIVPLKEGLLDSEQPVFRAGGGYEKPWTRDAAINVWNGGALLYPAVARNTLLATLERRGGALRIAHEYDQYWDAIIWALGAWAYFLASGDSDFLRDAFAAARNTLFDLERNEFDEELGLFRGPAVYGDGVAAYPDIYARTKSGHSSILRWVDANPETRARPGYGLPMHALSTNCLYFRVYEVLPQMAELLGIESDASWSARAETLRKAINLHFWSSERGLYNYLHDKFGGSDVQEGFGHSFAILFGIADADQRESIFRRQHVTPQGIACLWPCFSRYRVGDHYGRHSGTVWPPIQGFWAEAAARYGRGDIMAQELRTLAERAIRDQQFFELYHPDRGTPYGGLQEWEGRGIVDDWPSYPHQTWSATGFLRIVLFGLAGMELQPGGVRFAPMLPEDMSGFELTGLPYRDALINLIVEGHGRGSRVRETRVNGKVTSDAALSADAMGSVTVEILFSEN
jgi:glycogen debranching enzyme